jgi:hypothetical protein
VTCPQELVQFVRENPAGPNILDSGRRRDPAGADGGVETMQVGATGRLKHQASQSPVATRLGAPHLVDRRSELVAASPAGPPGCETAGTVTFLVMKIPFGRVLS